MIAGFLLKHSPFILIAAIVGFLVWGQVHTIPKLKQDIREASERAEVAQAETIQLKQDFATYLQNQERVNTILMSKTSITNSQNKLKASMNDISVQTVDKPFSDPGLLARAERLRDYQENSLITKYQ